MEREDGGVTGKSDGLMKAVAVAGMLLALLALPGGRRCNGDVYIYTATITATNTGRAKRDGRGRRQEGG